MKKAKITKIGCVYVDVDGVTHVEGWEMCEGGVAIDMNSGMIGGYSVDELKEISESNKASS